MSWLQKMIPFSWQRSVFDETDFFFLFAFSKGGVLKQGREEKKKREEYLNKLRLCWLAAFTLYNGALFAHFEYCNAHLSVKPFLWKIALTFKKKGGWWFTSEQFYIMPLCLGIFSSSFKQDMDYVGLLNCDIKNNKELKKNVENTTST